MTGRSAHLSRTAYSLLEVIAVAVLAGVLAVVGIMRYSSNDKSRLRKDACGVNKAEVDLQVQLWYRTKGTYPANNLSDIGGTAQYFPKGLPVCPVDGTAYTIDGTHQVTGHTH